MILKLFIVATPIGNLKDITLRAIETLKNVDVIVCEDTRVTHKLLSALEIKNKKLLSYHNQNERRSAKGLIELIFQGLKVAVVSDAGMPTISDPGYAVIKEAIANEIQVEIIPGVSAVTMASTLANFDTYFKFDGLLKPKTDQRQNQIKKWSSGTHIVYVSPHNVLKVLEDIEAILGPETNIFIGRELTKKFETHYRGNVQFVKEKLGLSIKGELTLVVEVKEQAHD